MLALVQVRTQPCTSCAALLKRAPFCDSELKWRRGAHGALTLEVRRRITRCCCAASAVRTPAVPSCISPFLQFLEVPSSHTPLQDFLLSMNHGKLPLHGHSIGSIGKRAAGGAGSSQMGHSGWGQSITVCLQRASLGLQVCLGVLRGI